MKKAILLILVLAAAFIANAQVFVENFATAPVNGNIEGYNDWKVSPKAADALGVSPKVAEGALFYTGYAGSNIGNVAVLDSAIGVTSANQRISTRIVKFGNDTLKTVVGQRIYTAFIANISTHSYRSYRDFFTYEGSKTSSSTRGRIFAKNSTAGDIFTIAVSKNSSTAGQYIESTSLTNLSLSTGINHLFVFCYDNIDGVDNDRIILYIDPDLTKTEAEQTNVLISTDVATDYGLTAGLGINLRQRGTGAQIGGIRVGKSWNSVVLGIDSKVDFPSIVNLRTVGKSILSDKPGTLSIFNLAGAEILKQQTDGRLETNLTNGLYLIRFTDTEGHTTAIKSQL